LGLARPTGGPRPGKLTSGRSAAKLNYFKGSDGRAKGGYRPRGCGGASLAGIGDSHAGSQKRGVRCRPTLRVGMELGGPWSPDRPRRDRAHRNTRRFHTLVGFLPSHDFRINAATTPVLPPLAAAGPAVIMAVAISLHARRREYSAIGVSGFLLLMAAFVAYGRWFLVHRPFAREAHDREFAGAPTSL